jgi:hypothetical protein
MEGSDMRSTSVSSALALALAVGGFAAGSHAPRKADVGSSGLSYSTFLGGGVFETVKAMAVGEDGSIYLAGQTYSPDFPTTPGAFDTQFSGGENVGEGFVARLTADGSSLIYSTFLGGPGSEGTAITVDASGAAYVAGVSGEDFPTTQRAYQKRCGSEGGFISKLNPTGTHLDFSTCWSGSKSIEGVAFHSNGDVFIAGTTNGGIATTPGAFDRSWNGNSDGFVARFDSHGSRLLYSTYLGSDEADEGAELLYGLTLDPQGRAIVVGSTTSTLFPTTPGAYDTAGDFLLDGFVTKLTEDGRALVFSTYLGGAGFDAILAIASGPGDALYLTGWTESPDFPTTPGAYDTEIEGGVDAFVAVLDRSGTALTLGTFISGEVTGEAIDVGQGGSVAVAGSAWGVIPTTRKSFDDTFNGTEDAAVFVLAANGRSLTYSSFLGGPDVEEVAGVKFCGGSFVCVGGWTNSNTFPVTPGAYDTTYEESEGYASMLRTS